MKKRIVLGLIVLLLFGTSMAFAAGSAEQADTTRVAVVTPYMANATTAYVIEQFKADAEALGWKVSVSDTAGDFGLLVSRIEGCGLPRCRCHRTRYGRSGPNDQRTQCREGSWNPGLRS